MVVLRLCGRANTGACNTIKYIILFTVVVRERCGPAEVFACVFIRSCATVNCAWRHWPACECGRYPLLTPRVNLSRLWVFVYCMCMCVEEAQCPQTDAARHSPVWWWWSRQLLFVPAKPSWHTSARTYSYNIIIVG